MLLSACIETLFTEEADFVQRAWSAYRAGADGIEFWRWRGKDVHGLHAMLGETGLRVFAFMSEHAGLSTETESLVDTSAHKQFLQGVADSSRIATMLGCPFLVVHSGMRLPGASDGQQRDAVVAGLKKAARIADGQGVTLAIEPLNTHTDHPGHFLNRTSDALDIVDEVGSPRVRLVYDLYHSLVMGEDPERVLNGRVDRLGHVHLADVPGRHESGTGTADWNKVVGWLAQQGYRGGLGLECFPLGDSRMVLADTRAVLRPFLGSRTTRPST